jgi:hypothetical protein
MKTPTTLLHGFDASVGGKKMEWILGGTLKIKLSFNLSLMAW